MNDEARIEQLAKRLGSDAAERLDVRATARKVVERLREAPAKRTTWAQPTWLRIAAAVVLLVGGGVLVGRLTTGVQSPGIGNHGAHYVADDLNDLSATELQDVLRSFDAIISTDSVAPSDNSDLHQLDAQQLREVLRSLEG